MKSLIPQIANHDPDSPAISISDKQTSYGDFLAISGAIARAVKDGSGGPLAVVAIFSEKSLFTYAGIFGIHCAGKGYVPLLPSSPPSRLVLMLDQVQTDVLILARGFTRAVSFVLNNCANDLLVVCEDESDSKYLASRYKRHRFTTMGEAKPEKPIDLQQDAIAYIVFTSGSTGNPKGVPVRFSNLKAYLRNILPIANVQPGDRCTLTSNFAFDLSVHEIFVTLYSGACLYPLNKLDLLTPAKFVRKNEITCWVSVPTLAILMERTRTLKPNVFPSLKVSLFCGEALPINTAQAWSRAAPDAKLFNLYGPTEATVEISSYLWNDTTPNHSRNGIVPIGTVFSNQQYKLLSDKPRGAAGTERGELAIAGDQVTSGYLDLPEETSERFIRLDGNESSIWYRTGDLVEKDETGNLHFLRRIDKQVQVRGFRVELQEVEHHLRSACASDLAIALAINDGSTTREIISVVADSPFTTEEILTKCAELMPTYMVPSRVEKISKFPMNSNGKIDRKAVLKKLLNHEDL